jgi:putative inorganic carbon (HCO3(-)) transporter
LAFPHSPVSQSDDHSVALAVAVALTLTGLWLLYPMVYVPVAAAVLLLIVISTNGAFAVFSLFAFLVYFKPDAIFPQYIPHRMAMLVGALSIVAIGWHFLSSKSHESRLGPELKAFLVFYAISTIGLLFADDKSIALEVWATFTKVAIATLALAWILSSSSRLENFARLFIVGGIILSISTYNNRFLGVGVVEMTRATAGTGLLSNPNDLALLLLIPLSFSSAFLVVPSGWFNFLLSLGGVPLITYAIMLTQSRGGLLGTVAVLAVVARRLIRSKVMLAGIIILALVAMYAAMDISNRISGGALDTEQASVQGRISAWRAGIQMAVDRPLTGVGIGNFTQQSQVYNPALNNMSISAHSLWMQVLGETGLPGFGAFIAMVVLCLRQVRCLSRGLSAMSARPLMQGMALALTAGLVSFCVTASFASFAYQWPLYILLAMIAALGRLSLRFV